MCALAVIQDAVAHCFPSADALWAFSVRTGDFLPDHVCRLGENSRGALYGFLRDRADDCPIAERSVLEVD